MTTVKALTEEIYAMASQCDILNPVDVSKSPNENLIFTIWSDGEITFEKGSWAYGMRTLHTAEFPIKELEYVQLLDSDKFPAKHTSKRGTFGYATVTEANALLIRNKMKELAKLLTN